MEVAAWLHVAEASVNVALSLKLQPTPKLIVSYLSVDSEKNKLFLRITCYLLLKVCHKPLKPLSLRKIQRKDKHHQIKETF